MLSLDRVCELWPNRKISQGTARAYIRFCETPQPTWEHAEQRLWEQFLYYLELKDLWVIDLGAGPGKMTELLIKMGCAPNHIFAFEPNDILMEYLFHKNLGINCVHDEAVSLSHLLFSHQELDLLVANMVVNQLPDQDFIGPSFDANRALKIGGRFAYTIPTPEHKRQKYRLRYDETATIEEFAPWGGLVTYYHRPLEAQKGVLKNMGFAIETRSTTCSLHTIGSIERTIVIATKAEDVVNRITASQCGSGLGQGNR